MEDHGQPSKLEAKQYELKFELYASEGHNHANKADAILVVHQQENADSFVFKIELEFQNEDRLKQSPVVYLHWAMRGSDSSDWQAIPPGWKTDPPISLDGGGKSWDTQFAKTENKYRLTIELPKNTSGFSGIVAVIRNESKSIWWKAKQKNNLDILFPSTWLQDDSTGKPANASTPAPDQKQPDRIEPEKTGGSVPKEQSLKTSNEGFEASLKSLAALTSSRKYADMIARTKPRVDISLDTAHWAEGFLLQEESKSKRSLMHRYETGCKLVEKLDAHVDPEAQKALLVMFIWLRFAALRQLVINENYNVKPREISSAQRKLILLVEKLAASNYPLALHIFRMLFSTLGTAAEGDVGQRIRDEILVLQRNNDCKGGMMEEWHQKLHNNSSPDDIVICEALLEYVNTCPRMDVSVYWKHLEEHGIDKKRLLSYDRAIHNEPRFRPDQCEGLKRDLKAYLKTLKQVFSGGDLESSISRCLGYQASLLKGTKTTVDPVSVLVGNPRLVSLLQAIQRVYALIEFSDSTKADIEAQRERLGILVQALVECRQELAHTILVADKENALVDLCRDRFADIVQLDIALDSQVRTAVEQFMLLVPKGGGLSADSPLFEHCVRLFCLTIENGSLSANPNGDIAICWRQVDSLVKSMAKKKPDTDWALRMHATLQRLSSVMEKESQWWMNALFLMTRRMGQAFHCESDVVDLIPELVVRDSSFFPIGQLLSLVLPVVLKLGNLSPWHIISRGAKSSYEGIIHAVPELLLNQEEYRDHDSIVLVADVVQGEADIPFHVVVVVSLNTLDVLSHIAVRARNEGKLLACCFDADLFHSVKAKNGQSVTVKIDGGSLVFK
eukprot:CAMPEP_0184698584 /NCGR_PEP_ID=MMETSP0313-20130426/5155_1 /TAXON_ID=2792 /ORGANISM="Porphyridium aerugineum, Strain SAG 1380-2" /LENGTH=842 /DNA_ID=CAMNT_0027157547 /DNA_START=26 /DNA_END=2554 /DNA_ORIENTATION=-